MKLIWSEAKHQSCSLENTMKHTAQSVDRAELTISLDMTIIRGEVRSMCQKKKWSKMIWKAELLLNPFFSQTSSNHVFKGKARFLKHPSFVFFCVSVSSEIRKKIVISMIFFISFETAQGDNNHQVRIFAKRP